jgi:hypothetical protein
MNIKSLLIGSAAALAAVTGAQAADAIVAAEPEPLEYVRVCDAFGAGYFYIPGTETCLKIDGEVRFSVNFDRDAAGTSDWDAATRARLNFTAKNDTEFGALTSYIALEGTNDEVGESRSVGLRQAYIDIAGLRVGHFNSWWDDDIIGEADNTASNVKFNAIQYTYDAGSFRIGGSVEELDFTNNSDLFGFNLDGNYVGASAMLGTTIGGVDARLVVSYDDLFEEFALYAYLTADLGPGKLAISGSWASDPTVYYNEAEWTVGAAYALAATDKLTITPSVSYENGINFDRAGTVANGFYSDQDQWNASVLFEYNVAQGLVASANVGYFDRSNGGDDGFDGFLRLTRKF